MPCWAANTDALPTYWNPIMNRLNAEKFPVAPGSEEYTRVEKAFMLTLDDPSRDLKRTQFTIQSVERIQNMDLWNSYVAKRKSICGRKSPKDAQSLVRNWLFHGCSGVVTDKIVQQGFNRSFCGKNATMYGKGVYFARDASYSTYPLYSQRDANDVQSIFLARVVVGEYCRGVKDALTPAERDATTHALYDSTVDDPQNPNIFVTYKDGQAYPEYDWSNSNKTAIRHHSPQPASRRLRTTAPTSLMTAMGKCTRLMRFDQQTIHGGKGRTLHHLRLEHGVVVVHKCDPPPPHRSGHRQSRALAVPGEAHRPGLHYGWAGGSGRGTGDPTTELA